jgi:hypothetical protein
MESVNEKFQAGINEVKTMKIRTATVSQASTDLRVIININESDDPQDLNEVPVQVNGRAYQIQRGRDVAVPPEVVLALEHAVVDKAIPMKDDTGMVRGFTLRPSKRFPFRIVDEQSMAIMKAWKQESLDRRNAMIEAEQKAA